MATRQRRVRNMCNSVTTFHNNNLVTKNYHYNYIYSPDIVVQNNESDRPV